MSALRELLLEFGIDVDDADLKKADDTIASTVSGIASGLAIVERAAQAVIGVVSGVAEFVAETIGAGAALADSAAQAQMTTEQFQRLGFIAGQAGVEASQLTTSVVRLQRAAVAGARGGGEMGRTFERLGVNVRDARGEFKDGPALFREVGLAIGRMSSSTEQAATAQQVFGRSGTALLPIFAQGEAGIAQLEARFAELGGGMSGEFVANADAADDALNELKLAWTALKSELVVSVIPAIRDVTTFLADAVAAVVSLTRSSSIVEATLIGVGIALAALAALLAPVLIPAFGVLAVVALAVVAPIAFLVLLIDDLITFFRGGKSVIGRFFDEFVPGGSKAVLMQIKQAIEDVTVAFEVAKIVAVAAWRRISARASELWGALTGGFDAIGASIANFAANAWGVISDAMAAIGIDVSGLSGFFEGVLTTSRGLIDEFVTWAQNRLSELTGGLLGGTAALAGVDLGAITAQVRAARAASATGQTTGATTAAGARAPGAVTVPRARNGRAGARVSAPVSVTIHAPHADAREVSRIAGREVDRALARTLRNASASLTPVAPAPAAT